MPPNPLVSVSELQSYLQTDGTDNDLLQQLLDQAFDLLVTDCDRRRAPFAQVIEDRTEVHEAIGGFLLPVDYPIQTITTIKLGRNFTSPDLTLDPTNPEEVYWGAGDRQIRRTNGEYWNGAIGGLMSWARGGAINEGVQPGRPPVLVQVVYDTQADLPPAGAQAVTKLAAALYGQRGKDGIKSESLGQYSYTLADLAGQDTLWRDVVSQLRRGEFR